MKLHLLVFSQLRTDPDRVRAAIERVRAFPTWMVLDANVFVVKTDLDAKAAAEAVRQALPGLEFVVSEVSAATSEGLLPRDAWRFMETPMPVVGGTPGSLARLAAQGSPPSAEGEARTLADLSAAWPPR